jgi:hypothetical protein
MPDRVFILQAKSPNPEWINKFQPVLSNSLANFVDDKGDSQTARALVTAIIEYQVPSDKEERLIEFCGLLTEMNRYFGIALWVELIRQCAGDSERKPRMKHVFFEGLAKHQVLGDDRGYFEQCFAVIDFCILFYGFT